MDRDRRDDERCSRAERFSASGQRRVWRYRSYRASRGYRASRDAGGDGTDRRGDYRSNGSNWAYRVCRSDRDNRVCRIDRDNGSHRTHGNGGNGRYGSDGCYRPDGRDCGQFRYDNQLHGFVFGLPREFDCVEKPGHDNNPYRADLRVLLGFSKRQRILGSDHQRNDKRRDDRQREYRESDERDSRVSHATELLLPSCD